LYWFAQNLEDFSMLALHKNKTKSTTMMSKRYSPTNISKNRDGQYRDPSYNGGGGQYHQLYNKQHGHYGPPLNNRHGHYGPLSNNRHGGNSYHLYSCPHDSVKEKTPPKPTKERKQEVVKKLLLEVDRDAECSVKDLEEELYEEDDSDDEDFDKHDKKKTFGEMKQFINNERETLKVFVRSLQKWSPMEFSLRGDTLGEKCYCPACPVM
jgi:hypothetical protein